MAYEELVRRHQAVAIRTAHLFAGGADADDAVQEAFVKAHAALGRFRADAPFRPWLLRIVANEARNRRRSAGRRAGPRPPLRRGSPVGRRGPVARVGGPRRRTARRLLAAISGLRDEDREVSRARYLLDLSEAETAEVLACPNGTVKSRLSRAIDRLREGLGANDGRRTDG